MQQHVKAVAIIHIIFGAMGMLSAIALFTIIAGAGAISGDTDAMWATGAVATFVGGLLAILSLPSIIAGIGLLRYRPWARIVTIIISCIDLMGVPIGTAVGAYSLWVLFNPEAIALFPEKRPLTVY
jgi:hypothetical protein